ncbi:MAG: TonB-dependent receptor [Gammaproteobacteria bacterium]|nr:TonB-dependent receptor [Gammaproteobacteria bacterium]
MLKFSMLTIAMVSSYAIADDIEHISVYANRQSQPVNETLTSLTVLDREQILKSQVRDLPALLNLVAGVSVSRSGGRGQLSSVFVRGGNSGHTLILLDGVRIGSATLGYQSLALVPLEQIEKIEIIRGPKAAWYGSDALAGVIAITTRKDERTELNVSLGSFGQAEASIGGSVKRDDLRLFASVGSAHGDGFSATTKGDPDRDGFSQHYLKLGADYQTKFGDFGWQSNINNGFYEFDTSWGGDQADTQQDSHQLSWQGDVLGTTQQLRVSRSVDEDTSFGDDVARSLFRTDRDEVDYQLSYDLARDLTWLVGSNWYQESVQKDAPNYSQAQRTNQSVFTGVSYQWQQWLFDSAVRRDSITGYGAEQTYQLSGGYQLTDALTLRLSQGTGFKVPTFNELYWPQYGNPLLKPELSRSRELGFDYQQGAWTLNLTGFDRDLTNHIQKVGDSLENVLLATVKGAELTVAWQGEAWQSGATYTYLDGKNEKAGTDLTNRPANKLAWQIARQWQDTEVGLTAQYQSEAYSVSYPSTAELGSFVVWGIGASHQWQQGLTFRAKVDNLFDKSYQTNLGYQQAGVEFGLSVQVTEF